MIYARALTEVFQNNEDPRNGTAILQKIVNRSYHSIQGYDVSIKKKYEVFTVGFRHLAELISSLSLCSVRHQNITLCYLRNIAIKSVGKLTFSLFGNSIFITIYKGFLIYFFCISYNPVYREGTNRVTIPKTSVP